MIPYTYFEFLRTQEAFRVVPIFHHNAIDILSLACLTAIVPFAFRSPEDAPLRRGPDLIGLARWLDQAGRREEALSLFGGPWIWGCPTICCFARCGTSRPWRSGWGAKRRRWRRSRNWRNRATPTASARSKKWPSTTSTASAI